MLLAVSLAILLPVGFPDEPFLDVPFPEALTRAGETDRVVLIDFFTTWCGPCKKLDAVTWRDDAVRDWLGAHCVAIKVDAEKEVELAERFTIDAYPSIVLVRPDGTELGRLVGFRSPSDFLAEIPDVLAGVRASDKLRHELDERGWDDVELRQELASALADEHRDREALEQYLWCYDEGLGSSPAFSGVRNSFLLGEIAELGRRFPPALDALRARRDAAKELLLAGEAPLVRTQDFSAINRALGEEEDTLQVFDLLKGRQQARGGGLRYDPRHILFEDLRSRLVQERRYAEFLGFVGSVEDGFQRFTQVARMTAAFGGEQDEELLGMTKDFCAEDCGLFYEALLGVGDRDPDAAELLERVLEFRDTPAVRRMLAGHARRAGRAELARQIMEHAQGDAPNPPLAPQAPGSTAPGTRDPMAVQREAEELVAQHRYEEACERFFLCYDEGARWDPTFVGVRNSFLLLDIVQLGTEYEPALEELRRRRDRLEENALAGKGTLDDVMDLAAINRSLQEPERSLKVFDGLKQGSRDHGSEGRPTGRDLLFDEVKSLLVQRRRYADYVRFVGTVDEGFARCTRLYELMKSTSDGSESDQEAVAFSLHSAIRDSAEFLEALSGSGAPEEDMRHLVELVLQLDDSPASRATLAEHARRAGAEALARELSESR